MRKTTIMTEKIIAFCLAFILGFFSAFGAIAGGIYYAYSTVSVDMLSEWAKYFNINLPIDDYVNKDAEKPISSLSIEDLLKEIQAIQSSKLTIDEMINKYGLIIPADILDKLPDSVKNGVSSLTIIFMPDTTWPLPSNVPLKVPSVPFPPMGWKVRPFRSMSAIRRTVFPLKVVPSETF